MIMMIEHGRLATKVSVTGIKNVKWLGFFFVLVKAPEPNKVTEDNHEAVVTGYNK